MSPLLSCPVCAFRPLPRARNEIKLGGIKFPLFKDYLHRQNLATQLAALSFHEKLKYFEARVKLVILDPLGEILRLEKSGVTRKYHSLNLITILSCAIDGLGSFLVPAGKTKKDCFEAFATGFMDRRFRNKICKSTGTEYWKFMWDFFRNGMAHSVCIEKGGLERRMHRYFKDDPVAGLIIDVDLLVKDFRKGVRTLFKQLRTGGTSGVYANRFEDRFNRVFLRR